ncbi:hypothetical protein M434DRAFT_29434 [Hypoxylon sp. CO27-5]|nr:hypothetical protein M434DRAFT_29434 [Hypoxylon sp. CO27-5]
MDVNGVALVVGAGSGIGLETALLFAERGARAVVFADQAFDAASEASEKSKSIATAGDYQTMAIAVDVRDRASVKAMVEEVKKRFARLDYAANSAGATEADTTSADESEYDLLHDVNAKGILHCLQEEIVSMKDQEPAHVEGRSGRRTLENRKSGLRINEVCPGFTDTPTLRRGFQRKPEIKDLINKSMPLGRAATAEEIANVIHFLASPGASFVNGQSIIADSGVSIAIVS